MDSQSAAKRADVLVRTTCGLTESALRVGFMKSFLNDQPFEIVAPVLDVLCARAEQADPIAREALVAFVDSLHDPSCARVVQMLREEAVGVPYLALERIVRQPLKTSPPPRPVPHPEDDRQPDYGRGRPLTLGERKSLARKPTREMMDRLLRDPHPDVIRQVLRNPKLTEDDLLPLAARRPCRPDVLTEIARSPRWAHRPRIRIALVLNPDTPLDLCAPILGLLMAQELRLVATSTTVAPGVRALCLEHLERRPPGEFEELDDDRRQLQ